ncbi:hypothetical protein [Sanguibacter inulinus]|uniref:Ribbon-helix-helix protein CopG domain-containing protein n=1 Tax=Sanguibacter inulinus TaxID=60922 RepID=A0A853EXA2_9MICO|nr:hypothetical protein [Sanguibacter inulinus]MBF0722808.1 hypothetical protein [Sanguibacter inulinus]NYS93953.1 hypothetical protein [Sanguibacter inulinus]
MSIDHTSLAEEHAPGASTDGAATSIPARRGRPPLDPRTAPGACSPVWHVRAPLRLDVAARDRAAQEGWDLSTLVREAVAAYLRAPSEPEST